jgi:hypothetical protein
MDGEGIGSQSLDWFVGSIEQCKTVSSINAGANKLAIEMPEQSDPFVESLILMVLDCQQDLVFFHDRRGTFE